MRSLDALGYLAASLVLATFCAKKMVPLRALAIASNIAFVAYAFFAGLGPILLLHSVMLPLNILRLREALGAGDQLCRWSAAGWITRSRRPLSQGGTDDSCKSVSLPVWPPVVGIVPSPCGSRRQALDRLAA